jgi:hypothetical protein
MIIDYGATPPSPAFQLGDTRHLANYRRVYAESEKASGRFSPGRTMEDYLADCDAAGVRHVVVKARDVETTHGSRIDNAAVAAFCRQHGDRFIGFAGVDPNKGATAVRELEEAVRDYGLRGLNIQGFENRVAIDDPKMFSLYAKCVELDIPLNIHCGINFSLEAGLDFGRPEQLDLVLRTFPDLRVCAAPPGWPWVMELLAVAWRHPNLRIGLVAVRPKLLAVEHSGYGPLLQYGRTVLKDRILFGSAYPMLPLARSIAEVRALPIDDDIADRWLHTNAAAFLRL